MELSPSPSQNSVTPARVRIFIGIMLVIFSIFVIRLVRYQLIEGDVYLAQAEENRQDTINLPAARGNIYDRNGLVLATNIASYNLVVTPADLPFEEGSSQAIFRELSELVDVPVNLGEINDVTPFLPCISDHGIAQIVEYGETTAPYRPVEIKCDLDRQTAMIVQQKALDWPGISIQVTSIREYPTSSITSVLVGYLGRIPAAFQEEYEAKGFVTERDKIGYAGVEFQFQDDLGGVNGLRTLERDVAGAEIRTLDLVPAQPGLNAHLTIDLRLQTAVDTIIRQELDGWNRYLGYILSLNAVAIAINPKTGEILSMVSIPTYENNRFARGVSAYYYEQLLYDQSKPFLNHAISAEHPPGSVFKLVTATGALNEGVIQKDQIIEAPGKITVEEKFFAADFGSTREFVDWNRAGFGEISFVDAIANSSNVYFYKVGGGYQDEIPNGGLGICRVQAYAEALGYGQVLGIELPGEADGLLPDPRWKRITQGENWSTGDTYIASVGQGYVLVTPLQMLMSAATIANDGKLMQPTIIKQMTDGEGNIVRDYQPVLIHDAVQDPSVTEFIQYVTGSGGCQPTGNKLTIRQEVFDAVQEGMRNAVVYGTLKNQFADFQIAAAGKTGTAEYCDPFAQAKDLCKYGAWPRHAWTIAYAPYEDPEIAVVVFVYNGGEGASVAGPIVERILQAYFEIKALDTAAP